MNGATDAVSGTSIMMETSRVFYELMKTGESASDLSVYVQLLLYRSQHTNLL